MTGTIVKIIISDSMIWNFVNVSRFQTLFQIVLWTNGYFQIVYNSAILEILVYPHVVVV